MTTLIATAADWHPVELSKFARPAPVRGVLVCEPTAFDVVDVRNAHMSENVGRIDRAAAREEWKAMVHAFEAHGLEVETLPPRADSVDMVFTANPCLTGVDQHGSKIAILSRMRHPERVDEVESHEEWLTAAGYRLHQLPDEVAGAWEGGGDAIWHPGHAVLWGGYGERSDREIYPALADLLGIPIATLKLVDPAFYHLDTCLAVLGPSSAAWIPSAFDDTGRELLEKAFETLVEVDLDEGRAQLACNLYCPNGETVYLPAGSPVTRGHLEARGHHVVEIETGEFLKSGGSIYCMRQDLYATC
ncbi:MAG: arginine deiminase-related protein [Planctomycetota bacterium]